MLSTGPESAAGVAVSRDRRSFRAVHVDRLNRLGPHVIQAYRNAERISSLDDQETPGTHLLDARCGHAVGRRSPASTPTGSRDPSRHAPAVKRRLHAAICPHVGIIFTLFQILIRRTRTATYQANCRSVKNPTASPI